MRVAVAAMHLTPLISSLVYFPSHPAISWLLCVRQRHPSIHPHNLGTFFHPEALHFHRYILIIGVNFHASMCIGTSPQPRLHLLRNPFMDPFSSPAYPFYLHAHACSVRVPSLEIRHISLVHFLQPWSFGLNASPPTLFTPLSASTLRCSQIVCTTNELTLTSRTIQSHGGRGPREPG